MNETWITTFSVALVGLGVLAELNLLQVFLREWREGRREERARSFRTDPQVRAVETTPARPLLIRRGLAACLVGPALTGSVAYGQDGSGETFRSNKDLSRAFQPADPPKEEPKALTISTDRPSFCDTAGIVPIGHFQLETGYTFTFRDRNGTESQTHNGPEVLARVALIDDRLELRLSTSGYVWSRTDSGSGFEGAEGWGDLLPGVKLKVTDQDGAVPRIALEFATTVGLGSHEINNRDIEPVLKLIWSYDLGDGWGVYGNFNVAYATAAGERFTQGHGGVCLTFAPTDRLSFFGEYFVLGPNTKGSDAAHYLDFGTAYLLTNRIQLDARAGFGLNEEANNLFTGVGLSFLF